MTASIGISLFPNDGSDESTLLKNADVAMHHAKAQGKNRFQYFDAEINRAVLRRHALEARLRLARQRNAFDLHYQPKISIANGTMVGAEALIRWTDPDLGAVSPAEFIPVAERAGLIGSIGHFVVSRVINDILEWHSAGLNPPPIAGACKNFCVNGHLAGNCRAPRSDDGRSKESSTEGVAGQPAG